MGFITYLTTIRKTLFRGNERGVGDRSLLLLVPLLPKAIEV
jgi:hypothetical protein